MKAKANECAVCRMLSSRSRVTLGSDGGLQPFVVIEYKGRPLVALRKHVNRPPVQMILAAVKALREAAIQKYGGMFSMNVRGNAAPGHWTASAAPMRSCGASGTSGVPEEAGEVRCSLCGHVFVFGRKHLKFEAGKAVIRCPRGCRLELNVDTVLHAA